MTKRVCSVDGCDRKHLARGFCHPHLARWRRSGDPGAANILTKVRRQGTVCAVDSCDRSRTHRDWCQTHYARHIKHGDPGSAEILHQVPRACAVDGCPNRHDNNGYCVAHAHRLRKYGSPTHIPIRKQGGDPTAWRSRTVGYMGAHNRTRRLRGNARTHACTHCGADAHDWAYDHKDPQERRELVNGYELPFSQDPAHYIPLCKPCHVVMDKRVADGSYRDRGAALLGQVHLGPRAG